MTIPMANAPARPRGVLRSIVAVLGGLLVTVILSLGTDSLLHATGIYPPMFQPMSTGLWGLATGYRIVYGIAGGYVTARLAPDRPMRHALILGVIGLVLSIVGAAVNWNKGAAYGPHWYPLALIAIALPTCWAGAKLWLAKRPANAYR